jgi:hypothetical protein
MSTTVNNNRPQMPQLSQTETDLVDKAKSEMTTNSTQATTDLATAAKDFATANPTMANPGQGFGMAMDGYERSQGTSKADSKALSSLLPAGDEPTPPPGGGKGPGGPGGPHGSGGASGTSGASGMTGAFGPPPGAPPDGGPPPTISTSST